MRIDPRRTRRDYLRVVAGGTLFGLAGCVGDGTETGDGDGGDPSPTATDADGDATPTGESGTDSDENRVVRLSPVEDRHDVWRTGLVAIYPTDLIGWLREVAVEDRTLHKRVSTAKEAPDPPLQVLQDVRFVDDRGHLDGHYDLDVDAGARYELLIGAEPADPPPDAPVTPVADLAEQRRELAIAAIEADAGGNRVYPWTELGEWVREQFFEGFYRYEGQTYRGYEVGTETASSSTEAWYVLSASPSREGDDDTYLLLPDFDGTVREELDAAAVGERTDELVVTDPSEQLAALADRVAMLLTHLTIFRVDLETE